MEAFQRKIAQYGPSICIKHIHQDAGMSKHTGLNQFEASCESDVILSVTEINLVAINACTL